MTAPMPVEIVRPNLTGRELLTQFVGSIAFNVFRAWLVMLLLPSVVDFRPGYWQVLIGIVVLEWTLADRSYLGWTR